MAGLGAVVAAVATTWVALDTALLWLTLDGAALFWPTGLPAIASAEDSTLDAGRSRWKFIFAETFQGITWGLIVWLIGQSGDPEARGFALVLLLLVAAMNATTSASIPPP
jgi:two-component system, cell cycle sensor histidine kinase PleC